VNEGPGQGPRETIEPPKRRATYHTRAVSLGRCLVGSLDVVSEALAVAEGEAFR
jgi:hypothetical protein